MAGVVVILVASALFALVNAHDLVAHLDDIDYRLSLVTYDLQLAFVELAVSFLRMLGSILKSLCEIFFFFTWVYWVVSDVDFSMKSTSSSHSEIFLLLLINYACMQLGGPRWMVQLGCRDTTIASQRAANNNLPGLGSSLVQRQARCTIASAPTSTTTQRKCTFASLRRQNCPASGGDGNLAALDAQAAIAFGNKCYQNLVPKQGLLHSDQELFNKLVAGVAGPAVQQQRVRLHDNDGEDEKHQPADGEPRTDQIEQQEGGLINYIRITWGS
ncbi:peroxidase P7-like [Canna indica]|uniref:Peroxidase P7-like n=1 Tax=Canna indica TaxID=4628 RepID=A0AAQ3KAC2_9LILI|nr:peroxidase P7-like [Canna indica]